MKAYGISDKGAVRGENQDCFRIKVLDGAAVAALVLCDGMGGESSGGLAAAVAADAFMAHAALCMAEKDPPSLAVTARESASYANICVFDRSRSEEACAGMGTTLVGLLVRGQELALVNVGDSRCYRWSGGQLVQLTQDHSLVADLLARGVIGREEAHHHPRRNVITRAIGLEYRVKSDVFQPDLAEGDWLMLCSDGLTNTLEESTVAGLLAAHGEPEEACAALLQAALDAGAADNVTVMIFCR